MATTALHRRLGRVIRRHREALGLSQEDFAYEVGIHRTYVSLLERGAGNPSLTVIEAIAKRLGTPVSSLFSEAESLSR